MVGDIAYCTVTNFTNRLAQTELDPFLLPREARQDSVTPAGARYSGAMTSSRWPSLPSATMVPRASRITRQASCEVLSLTS